MSGKNTHLTNVKHMRLLRVCNMCMQQRHLHFPGTLNCHFTLTFHSCDAGKQEKNPSSVRHSIAQTFSYIAKSSFTPTDPLTHQTRTVLFEYIYIYIYNTPSQWAFFLQFFTHTEC